MQHSDEVILRKKAIAGMRDIAAHKYQTLRMEDVYNTAYTDFVALKEQLEKLL